ncbi:hypothetical protein JTE90_024244 [Oedothorax gibbosus]|uniref:YTH domain-containing protein n=1 Tax=Oedothorax gibbosus TaxID=931172 RepID=A0AAV6TYL6_9ARAC|nr:hypothetical protein JTE90_024244 [Oedothorax gibbosus]
MDAKAEVEMNLLDELLDPIVDDELIAELDSQEKKAAKNQVSPQKVPPKSDKDDTKAEKKVVKNNSSTSASSTKKMISKPANSEKSVRQVTKASQKSNSSTANAKKSVRIVKKIVSKSAKTASSKSSAVPTKIIQKPVTVKQEPSDDKGGSAPKKPIPTGLSAPSTVRKSAKVVSKNPNPLLSTNSQTTVKCVLRGTDPESKALAAYKSLVYAQAANDHRMSNNIKKDITMRKGREMPDHSKRGSLPPDNAYTTLSDASSSLDNEGSCSCGHSSAMSSSPSVSRSGSPSGSDSNSDSESEEERVVKRPKKRPHSPVVYEKKDGKEHVHRSVKRHRMSSSVSKKGKLDYSYLLKYFFRDARFFLVKSNNHENVALSKAKGVWSTPPQNESKLNQAFRTCKNVILIFSVKESGKFQGFARMSSESRHDIPPIQWVLPPGLSARALGGVFYLDYVCRRELSFTKTQHLYNPWNESKQVKIGRDGQEIEPKVGEELCRLFPVDENIDLISILRNMKRNKTRSSAPSTREDRDHRSHREHRRPGNVAARRSSPDPMRRRRRRPENFEQARPKRNRQEYEGFYRGMPGRDRSPSDRFRNRPNVMNGQNYGDYPRDYHQRNAMPVMPYGPPCNYPQPPFAMEPPAYYDSRSMHHPDYNAPPRPRPVDKRAYERSVDEFIRRTARVPSSSRGADRRYNREKR